MAAMLLECLCFQRPVLIQVLARTVTQRYASQESSVSTPTKPPGEVPGLSSAVYKVPTEEVGPGASKTSQYKNPEYFCYNKMSYFEAEVEMMKYRLPQPSNKVKKN